jgi:hypothetical protein
MAYGIFAYPYVFNQVDTIQYRIKRATMTPLVAFDDTDKKQIEAFTAYIHELFSTILGIIIKPVVYIKTNVENLLRFIKNVKEDFAI